MRFEALLRLGGEAGEGLVWVALWDAAGGRGLTYVLRGEGGVEGVGLEIMLGEEEGKDWFRPLNSIKKGGGLQRWRVDAHQ